VITDAIRIKEEKKDFSDQSNPTMAPAANTAVQSHLPVPEYVLYVKQDGVWQLRH
jgi:hypothetical protein